MKRRKAGGEKEGRRGEMERRERIVFPSFPPSHILSMPRDYIVEKGAGRDAARAVKLRSPI